MYLFREEQLLKEGCRCALQKMNELILPSVIKTPPRQSDNNSLDQLMEDSSNVSPDMKDMNLSLASIPPNSGSILKQAFPATSFSGSRIGSDILTVQQRFDTSRRKLHQLSLVLKKERDPKQKQSMAKESRSLQLFSTLLYLTLMMHKIDELKVLLKENDPGTYVANQIIFDSLRSPNFHLQRHHESLVKMKKVFERKQRYKQMYDDTAEKLSQYEEKVGKLQDLATGAAHDFSQAMAKLASQPGANEAAAADAAAAHVEVKHLKSKVEGLEGSLSKSLRELEDCRGSLAKATSQLSKKDIALAKSLKDIELAKFIAKSDSEESSRLSEAKVEELSATLATTTKELESKSNSLVDMEAKVKQLTLDLNAKSRRLEAKEKECSALSSQCAELQNSSSAQGKLEHEKDADLLEVQAKLKQTEEALKYAKENDEALNHARKRVVVLESELEKETAKREEVEGKRSSLKLELEEVLGKLAELKRKGVDVGKLERQVAGKDVKSQDLLATSPFMPESSYILEEQLERKNAAVKLQLLFRKKLSYRKWFNLKLELTSKAGVMMALSGTAQGRTGFYLNPTTNTVYYWSVKESGDWVQMFDEITFDMYKEMEVEIRTNFQNREESKVKLIPVPGTKTVAGESGFYVNERYKAGYYFKDESSGELVRRDN